MREERVDDRNQINEQKSREHTSHNGKFHSTKMTQRKSNFDIENSNKTILFFIKMEKGSSNGHSPVLNLSKSGGLDQGSTGDQSDRSENQSPAQSIRDEDENLSEDNISDVDEREAKDDGKHLLYYSYNDFFFK